MQRLRPEEMLKMIKEGLDRLNETAPEIPNDVIKEYKTLFGALTDISKPTICNGLHHIEVYSQVIEKQLESKRMSVEMLPAVELLPVQNTMTKPEKKPWK
jgi:hypothetical protein